MTVQLRKRATKKYHATKNHRNRGAHRSAHARAHYQNGVVDKAPLEKMVPKDTGKRVVATWKAIANAKMSSAKNGNAMSYYIVEKDIKKFPLAQSYTKRTKDGAPTTGAIKLKEMLGAEGKLICCRCKVVFGAQVCGVEGNEIGSLSISCFQLDHIDRKRPSMSQGRSYKDYLHAYEQDHIAIKCYECIGLEYKDQAPDRVGNNRKYKARA